MSFTLMDVKFGWVCCPPEILWNIFKHLDYKSLVNCMLVNQRWKNIVEDYAEFHGLWKKIVGEGMINMGVTYRRKTTQDWKHILINSMLWNSLNSASVEHCHTYMVNDIKKIHIYRDNLIVKTKTCVKYFNIPNKLYTKVYNGGDQEIDFIENDYMIVVFEEVKEEARRELHLFGKVNPTDFYFNKNILDFVENVLLFRPEDNICYIVTNKFVVWSCKWTRVKWDVQLVGRYYGSMYDRLYAIHVFNNIVYLVTKYGLVLREVKETKSFHKLFNYNVPQHKCPTNWVMFHKHDVVVSVKLESELLLYSCGIETSYEKATDHLRVVCPNMTCATEHGEMLFIGFKTGRILICKGNNMLLSRRNAKITLWVRKFDRTIKDPAVLALDVFEDELSHHIFVATRNKILQLHIKYPINIRNYYNST